MRNGRGGDDIHLQECACQGEGVDRGKLHMAGNKRKKAVALKYEAAKDRAPKVAAKGSGLVAEHIIELAKKEGIPLQEDPDLVGVLMKLELQEEIPSDLYQAVAEILAFAYRLNRKMKEGR